MHFLEDVFRDVSCIVYKMKQFAYYIIYLLTCISAVSCVETIVMDPHEEMPTVVYCVLTNKSDVQTLDLSAAETPSGVKPEIKAREVVVTATPGGRIAFEHAEGARWEAHFTPHWGTAYSLRIVLENGEELTAETSFPDSIRVNDYYVDREHPDHKMYNPYLWDTSPFYADELFYADRLFSERAYDWKSDNPSYWNQTRNWGFKLLDPAIYGSEFHNDERWFFIDGETGFGTKYYENHPYQEACTLWVTARSPQKPEEFPLDALYVPGHAYRSVYLATDMAGVDNFNATQLTLGDLACYSPDRAKQIESAIEERDKELIPAFYDIWKESTWYGEGLNVRPYFQSLAAYADLPLHVGFLRLVYPEGGYINQYSLTDDHQGYDEDGNAFWNIDPQVSFGLDQHSPFTFQVFADFNLDDPYTWQWTTHNLATGWVVYEFHHVSEEYDAFLRTLYKAGYSDVFGDLTETLYSREGVYSNIKGGVGIFGAECVTVSLR